MKKILNISSYALILAMTATTSYAQTCSPNIQQTRPDSRYQDMGAEVKDNVTGLIWQRCSIGQTWNGNTCTGTATEHTWKQALTVAKNLGKGYRLPNIKELQSLIETKCYSPAINTSIFPNTETAFYWSSSPYVQFDDLAWGVNFNLGNSNVGSRYGTNMKNAYARAVRSE
ncbi:Lcl C-terminal domain-containing protein [Faucicola boevrei]|uniref:Lcl C-terminal domain-containing protein n=1 Tax=Faucicola boevrei TaxID=346665 RepID=UPI00036DF827|nr:DUF1566 domain-containing protein [Moraxella boevrei]